MPVVRWGIAGSGAICHDFTNAITMSSPGHQAVAVAARKLESAEAFAKLFDIPRAYEGYQNLADDKEVDIIYIGTIHPAHYEIARLMLNAGKHVLCEKPMTMNHRQTSELLQLAKEKNVFLMEGFWSKFFPVYKQLRSELEAGSIGEVRHVQVPFGVNLYGVDRVSDVNLGGGSLLDIGCYGIMVFCMIYGQRPERIQASATLRKGVDVSVAATLYYKNGAIAQLNCNADCNLENTLVVSGTKGMLKVDTWFHAPTKLITPSKTYEYDVPVAPKKMKFHNSECFVYEIESVGKCLAEGRTECPLMTHDMTLMNVEIIDEIRRQIGLKYDADEA